MIFTLSKMCTYTFSLLALLLCTCSAHPTHHKAPTRLIYQYPNSTWIENVAVRSNGEMIFTSINYPGEIHTINPLDKDPEPKLVGVVNPYNSTLGIVETEDDVFYLIASDFNIGAGIVGAKNGSNTIWRLDFNKAGSTQYGHSGSSPSTELVTVLSEAVFLNGLTKFNDTLLLAADSTLGALWAIDTTTGKHWIAVEDERMKPPADAVLIPEGINGAHFFPDCEDGSGKVYFTNSEKYRYGTVELDSDCQQVGPAKFIARPKPEKGFTEINWDDFALDANANAFVATEKGNSVQRVTPAGDVEIVAGGLNSTTIAEPSSAAFGRTERDWHILYVMTTGGLAFPVVTPKGTVSFGAQIVAVDVLQYLLERY